MHEMKGSCMCVYVMSWTSASEGKGRRPPPKAGDLIILGHQRMEATHMYMWTNIRVEYFISLLASK